MPVVPDFISVLFVQFIWFSCCSKIHSCGAAGIVWRLTPVIRILAGSTGLSFLLTLVPAVGSRYSCLLYFGIPRTPMLSFCGAGLHLFFVWNFIPVMHTLPVPMALLWFIHSCGRSASLLLVVSSSIVVPTMALLRLNVASLYCRGTLSNIQQTRVTRTDSRNKSQEERKSGTTGHLIVSLLGNYGYCLLG
jgi:hypothetical protein